MSAFTTNNILLPEKDTREYRHITLSNDLQCILVSDPTTEKSAACCDINVGSMSDPKMAQGLAHFLEHMLFMGTGKYPEENEYSAYLNNHGGNSNAYTGQENTVYYFDVQNEHFEHALDLFASFFSCPLFSEISTAREINAVDSEHNKNIQNDTWRRFQLFKNLVKEDHPLNSFSTGNLKTLSQIPEEKGFNIRDMMIEFYEKYYSANLMRVAIYGSSSLDELEKWAVEKFTPVPNKNLSKNTFSPDIFSIERLGSLVEIVPVKDIKNLELYFPIPSVKNHYLSKPVKYINHLLGHESEGSILSALKSKHWANGLSSYCYQSNQDFACIGISVELTEKGLEHTDEIISSIFSYIGILKRNGCQEWVWQELKEIADMNYRFLDNTDPIEYVVNLANNLQIYPYEHVLAGDYLLFEKDLQLSESFLNYLTPNNLLVFLMHKGLINKTAMVEEYYGTNYSVLKLSDEKLKLWNENLVQLNEWSSLLKMPQPNPFVATDFSLKEPSAHISLYPELISKADKQSNSISSTIEKIEALTTSDDKKNEDEKSNEEPNEDEEDESEDEDEDESSLATSKDWNPIISGEGLLTWYKPDTTWKVPKLNVFVNLETFFAVSTVWGTVNTDLLAHMLKEVLSEFSYYADCAGLYYDVRVSKYGLELFFQGYGHKLPVLVMRTLEELKSLLSPEKIESNRNIFSRVLERLIRSYKNNAYMQPYHHCIWGSYLCLEEPRFSPAEKYKVILKANYSSFICFVEQFLSQLKIETLFNGNITSKEAEILNLDIKNKLGCEILPYSLCQRRRGVDLFSKVSDSQTIEYIYRQSAADFNPQEINSAVENLYLIGQIDKSKSSFQNDTENTSFDFLNDELALEAMTQLVSHIMSEPAFDQLRTKEQLGYIVHTSFKKLAQNILTVAILVQSSHKDPEYLNDRIESFLLQFHEELVTFSSEKVLSYIEAVIQKLIEKPKNLDQESSKYWEEIGMNTYFFNRKECLVAKLQVLQKQSEPLQFLVSYFERYFSFKSVRRIKFSSQYFGKNLTVPENTKVSENIELLNGTSFEKKYYLIQDPYLFRQSMNLLTPSTLEK